MKPKRIVVLVLIVAVSGGAGFGIGLLTGWGSLFSELAPPETALTNLLWEAREELKARYIAPDELSDDELLYGAIRGLINAAGDPYTTFFTPNEARQFLEDASGHFDGIGAEIGFRNNRLSIIAPLPNSPAENAGLKSGDVILRIDSNDAANMTLEEAVSRIRGSAGTRVTLQIFREGENSPRDITITRDRITIPSFELQRDENNIAIIHIYNFSEDAPLRMRETALTLGQEPPDGIIIDLRNNPGGYLDAAVDIAGWFLDAGKTVVIERERGKADVHRTAEGSGTLADIPTVILVNSGTASAAEILAGALLDDRAVLLVGEATFGKGTIQEFPRLSGGAALKVTIGEWLTPSGHSLREGGLAPSIEIKDDPATEADEQFDQAHDKLLELIQKAP